MCTHTKDLWEKKKKKIHLKKIKRKPDTKFWDKETLQKCLWVHFLLALYFWACRPCFPHEIPSKKHKFPFTSGYQSETASGVGMRGMVHSSFHSGMPSNAGLCRPCACCHSLWVLTLISLPFLYDASSLVSSIHSSFYTLSASFSTGFPEPRGDWFDRDTPFRAECLKVSHSLHIYLWDFVFVPIHCRRELLLW